MLAYELAGYLPTLDNAGLVEEDGRHRRDRTPERTATDRKPYDPGLLDTARSA
jgi:hypothetical protein